MVKILLILLLTSAGCQAQNPLYKSFEMERINYDKKAMMILGGWSVVNIGISAFAANTHNRQAHYFHNMNMMWNGVNLLFATAGYIGANNVNADNITLAEVMGHQNKTEKLFLFNTGLDVAYVVAGFYLKERAKQNSNPSKLTGYGNAVAAQGAFLFLFDAILYSIHNKHGKKIGKFLSNGQVSAGPGSIGLRYHF